MKPVDQSKFGSEGDCVRACVASYLELPLVEVPEFSTTDAVLQWSAFDDFVEGLGYERSYAAPKPSEIHFASGLTERGLYHLVLMQDGNLIHDPHPSRAGLIQVEHIFKLVN